MDYGLWTMDYGLCTGGTYTSMFYCFTHTNVSFSYFLHTGAFKLFQ